ncbi:MAG: glutathione S-transferase N-terminal domain-containing protein [Acidiferrobacterales bacterium]|nr:glutathione S-transferase N-terminal domain-containing protein [Acidiferrobacterales bacterium]
MIDLYTWGTPNGRKVSIMLEEIGLDYTVHPINIMKDEQFTPDFLEISPNNKIPAIVDQDNGLSLMESGAILVYLAEKTGKLMTADQRWQIHEWLMFQMGGFGPMLGQAHHFLHFNKDASEYAANRYRVESQRLYSVLDDRLEQNRFVAGDYSIADIALWPWASRFEWQEIDLNEYENVKRWYLEIAERPAVQRGYKVPSDMGDIPVP